MNHLFCSMLRCVAVVAVPLFIIAGCVTAPVKPQSLMPGDYAYVREYLTWLTRSEMKKNDVQGLSIALVDDQQVVWQGGFGLADSSARIPADADTVYRVGSVSKLFTTIAAMQLVEQGKLELDKPLADYVPDFALRNRFAGAPPVTIRSIMTHHSGIPSDYLKGMWTKEPQPISALPALIRDEYAAFPRDTVFSYSNLGMSLLGLAVQNVSGREFSSHMQQALLTPLEMGHSAFSTAIDRTPPAARAYSGSEEKPEPPLRDIPAGGLNASVRDMSRFIRMILAEGTLDGQRIIKPETLREMLSTQNRDVALDRGFRVGLGWMLDGLGGINIKGAGTVAHHAGATLYHRAQIIVLPQVKLGVIILANSSDAQKVVNTIATEALKLAVEVKTGVKQPEDKPVVTGEFLTKEELLAYEGSYATIAGLGRLSARSGYLRGELMDRSFRLVTRQDHKLQIQYHLLGLIPIDLGELSRFGVSRETVAGHELLIVSDGEQEMLIGEKIVPSPIPIPVAWRRRIGNYRIINAGSDTTLINGISLREDGGLLLVEYRLPEFGDARISRVISPISDDEAVLSGLGRGMGETVRVVRENGVEQIIYSGYRLFPVGSESEHQSVVKK